MRRKKRLERVLALLTIIVCFSPHVTGAPRYEIKAYLDFLPMAVSPSGIIVGQKAPGSYVIYKDGKVIASFDHPSFRPECINDSAIIGGLERGGVLGFFQNGEVHNVDLVRYAASINRSGTMVGSTLDGPSYIYTNGAISYLSYPGSEFTQAKHVNDHGEIAGIYTTSDSSLIRAFKYSGGKFEDLGP